MTPHRCAMPDCCNDATGIFCADHYFSLPAKDARWLVRLQIMIARSDDAELKGHLREQLHGYTQQAVRTLTAQTEVRETLIERHLGIRDRDRPRVSVAAPVANASGNSATLAGHGFSAHETAHSNLDGELR